MPGQRKPAILFCRGALVGTVADQDESSRTSRRGTARLNGRQPFPPAAVECTLLRVKFGAKIRIPVSFRW